MIEGAGEFGSGVVVDGPTRGDDGAHADPHELACDARREPVRVLRRGRVLTDLPEVAAVEEHELGHDGQLPHDVGGDEHLGSDDDTRARRVVARELPVRGDVDDLPLLREEHVEHTPAGWSFELVEVVADGLTLLVPHERAHTAEVRRKEVGHQLGFAPRAFERGCRCCGRVPDDEHVVADGRAHVLPAALELLELAEQPAPERELAVVAGGERLPREVGGVLVDDELQVVEPEQLLLQHGRHEQFEQRAIHLVARSGVCGRARDERLHGFRVDGYLHAIRSRPAADGGELERERARRPDEQPRCGVALSTSITDDQSLPFAGQLFRLGPAAQRSLPHEQVRLGQELGVDAGVDLVQMADTTHRVRDELGSVLPEGDDLEFPDAHVVPRATSPRHDGGRACR